MLTASGAVGKAKHGERRVDLGPQVRVVADDEDRLRLGSEQPSEQSELHENLTQQMEVVPTVGLQHADCALDGAAAAASSTARYVAVRFEKRVFTEQVAIEVSLRRQLPVPWVMAREADGGVPSPHP
jgi:hypothetical protein